MKNVQVKTHYKSYKQGKHWVIGGIAIVGATGMIAAMPNSASADSYSSDTTIQTADTNSDSTLNTMTLSAADASTAEDTYSATNSQTSSLLASSSSAAVSYASAMNSYQAASDSVSIVNATNASLSASYETAVSSYNSAASSYTTASSAIQSIKLTGSFVGIDYTDWVVTAYKMAGYYYQLDALMDPNSANYSDSSALTSYLVNYMDSKAADKAYEAVPSLYAALTTYASAYSVYASNMSVLLKPFSGWKPTDTIAQLTNPSFAYNMHGGNALIDNGTAIPTSYYIQDAAGNKLDSSAIPADIQSANASQLMSMVTDVMQSTGNLSGVNSAHSLFVQLTSSAWSTNADKLNSTFALTLAKEQSQVLHTITEVANTFGSYAAGNYNAETYAAMSSSLASISSQTATIFKYLRTSADVLTESDFASDLISMTPEELSEKYSFQEMVANLKLMLYSNYYAAQDPSITGSTVLYMTAGQAPASGSFAIRSRDFTPVQDAPVAPAEPTYTPAETVSVPEAPIPLVTITIRYVDPLSHEPLIVDGAVAQVGGTIPYDPAAKLASLEKLGYKLATSDFVTGAKYDKDQTFTLTFEHIAIQASPTDPDTISGVTLSDLLNNVSRTIQYQYADGTKAADTIIQTVQYQRLAFQDMVNKSIYFSDWVAVGDLDNDSQIVSAGAVFDTSDIVDVVNHVLNQAVKNGMGPVAIIDANGKMTQPTVADNTTAAQNVDKYLKTLSGSDREVVMNILTQARNAIGTYAFDHLWDNVSTESQSQPAGTYLAYDSYNFASYYDEAFLKYYNAANQVDYDGLPELQMIPDFDAVLAGDYTPTPSDEAIAGVTFAAAESPIIAGYTASKATVNETTVTEGDPNTTETITYAANPQRVVVTFHDATTDADLPDAITLTGYTNDSIDFAAVETALTAYEANGYELVSDGTSNVTTFDDDQNTDQAMTITLRHATTVRHTPLSYSQTIAFAGTDTLPTPVYREVAVDQADTIDSVTKATVEGATRYSTTSTLGTLDDTTGAFTFADFTVPEISGYTADVPVVTGSATPERQNDVHTVNYSAGTQTAAVTFFDDTTGKSLGEPIILTGVSNATIDYASVKASLSAYLGQGYELVNDGTSSVTSFDAVPSDQTMTITLRHGIKTTHTPLTYTQTISFKGAESVPATVVREAAVDMSESFDAVTATPIAGSVVYATESTLGQLDATTGTFVFTPYAAPVITGYTLDLPVVTGAATPDSLTTTATINYTAVPVTNPVTNGTTPGTVSQPTTPSNAEAPTKTSSTAVPVSTSAKTVVQSAGVLPNTAAADESVLASVGWLLVTTMITLGAVNTRRKN
jgi:hypothetical protein